MKKGDRVVVLDNSDAHGEFGVISVVGDDVTGKMTLVELDSGAIWPVTGGEVEVVNEETIN